MEKIQQLTDKVYREGYERGQAEAARIIEEAQQRAEQIVATAQQKANEIESIGRKNVAEMEANTKNELKMYTAQALSALKGEVANVVCGTVVSSAVDRLVSDKEFLCKFTVALASKWVDNEPVVIATSEAESLKNYFLKEAKAVLDKGVTISKVNGHETMLTISPSDGSYRVNFGKEEFEDFFKSFLRPQLVEMLF